MRWGRGEEKEKRVIRMQLRLSLTSIFARISFLLLFLSNSILHLPLAEVSKNPHSLHFSPLTHPALPDLPSPRPLSQKEVKGIESKLILVVS